MGNYTTHQFQKNKTILCIGCDLNYKNIIGDYCDVVTVNLKHHTYKNIHFCSICQSKLRKGEKINQSYLSKIKICDIVFIIDNRSNNKIINIANITNLKNTANTNFANKLII
jgi:hypothetical protein